MFSAKKKVLRLFKEADIEIGGTRPWDIRVHNENFYASVIRGGRLALGETYMAGWWNSNQLDETVSHGLRGGIEKNLKSSPHTILIFIVVSFFNRQSVKRAFQVGKKHYDIGNELYTRMLDPWMQYSCGYWKEGVPNLNEAQVEKMELICRKLELKPGMRVLDIGCGWGGLAKYMAYHHKVSVVGLTISKEQAVYAKEQSVNLPVDIELVDYRKFAKRNIEPFDRVVSVGMFEHVGYKNYRIFMKAVHKLLRDDGLFLLHTIGGGISEKAGDPWLTKYIFPNGMLPSVPQIGKAIEGLFLLEDWHNFGADYDKTLMAWYENFVSAWPELKASGKYNNRFYRMWEYYLLSMAGAFRSRANTQLWQVMLAKDGTLDGYRSKR